MRHEERKKLNTTHFDFCETDIVFLFYLYIYAVL